MKHFGENDDHVVRHARLPHIEFPHIRFHRHELRDRPLAGAPAPDRPWHPKLYACEAVATALLMVLGICAVIALTEPRSPVATLLRPHPLLQTALCGLFFGSASTCAAMTPFGRVSGAHLSPSVSLAFSLSGRLAWRDLLGYIGAQIVGASAGTAIVWAFARLDPRLSDIAASAHYAATLPAPGIDYWWVAIAELLATAGLVFALAWGAAHPRLHAITPWISGLYFFAMNPVIAWVSGDSTNFARTLGPALFDGNISALWVYLIGPIAGSVLAVAILKSGLVGMIRIAEARIINFGHHGRVPRLEAPEATAHAVDAPIEPRRDGTPASRS